MERTFIMLKPDAVQRGLVGKITAMFEDKGCKLVGMKLVQLQRAVAEEHYAEHRGDNFFEDTVAFIISSPVVAMVWEGKNVIVLARELLGSTNPAQANPGSIRGLFAMDISRNVIHGSDSPTSAKREIELHFAPEELISYRKVGEEWLNR